MTAVDVEVRTDVADVVVVNHNTRDELQRCLESLAAAYVRGARGLLLWEPDQVSRPEAQPDGPVVW